MTQYFSQTVKIKLQKSLEHRLQKILFPIFCQHGNDAVAKRVSGY